MNEMPFCLKKWYWIEWEFFLINWREFERGLSSWIYYVKYGLSFKKSMKRLSPHEPIVKLWELNSILIRNGYLEWFIRKECFNLPSPRAPAQGCKSKADSVDLVCTQAADASNIRPGHGASPRVRPGFAISCNIFLISHQGLLISGLLVLMVGSVHSRSGLVQDFNFMFFAI